MTIDFSGKTVLVTGGSRGIGASVVEKFASANAAVFFTYANNKKAAEDLRVKLNNSKVQYFKCDLSIEQDIVKLNKILLAEEIAVDILINNAGIWDKGSVLDMSVTEWNETINTNLTGTFLITQKIANTMANNSGGKIINVSSTASQRGEAFYSHYAASKGALNSFTKSIAVELARHNINVNAVAPGWVETEMSSHAIKDNSDEILKNIPVGRVATVEDIAAPILFLASDYAKQITGEILNINGGSVLCG